jgi:serine protease Do
MLQAERDTIIRLIMRKLSGYGPSLIVLITAAVVLFAGPRIVQRLAYEHTRTQIVQARHSLESPEIGGMLERLNQAYRDIAAVVEPSVVHISAHYVERDGMGREVAGLSTGSGWVYDHDGHIVTNHHVIANAHRIDVQLHSGQTREARLVGADPTTDVAVIKIDSDLLHPAQLADPGEPVRQGDLVFAFGSPFDFRFSMSAGVVSGKDRSVGVLRDDSGRRLGYENFIQVDAAINPGNSGGPLTDYRGRVIGMNTAIATGRRAGSNMIEEGQFAGIGLAIPLDMIYPVVTQLITNGVVRKGFLGVEIAETPDENTRELAKLGYNGVGVWIRAVRPRQAAMLAGVKADDVVTHVNGRTVASVPQLQSIVTSMLPGDSARLSLWRLDRTQQTSQLLEIAVPLARWDLVRLTGRLPADQPRDSLLAYGIARMVQSTPELARSMNVPYRPGVMIQELIPESRLGKNFPVGSILVGVEGLPIRDVDELFEALDRLDLSYPVRVVIVDPAERTVRLALEAE